MSIDEQKIETATLEELETIWKGELRTMMEKIGTPDNYDEAEGIVLAEAAWTELDSVWALLPADARAKRVNGLLAACEKAAYSTRPYCMACGDCCRNGAPALYEDDKSMFDEGILSRKDVYTIRRGEMVRVPEGARTKVLQHEVIKLREDEAGVCMFLDQESNKCRIYADRPMQCRAQACWDLADIREMFVSEKGLTRPAMLSPDEPIAEVVIAHETRCAIRTLADAFKEAATGNEEAMEPIIMALAYDTELRPFLVDKMDLDPKELDFHFGRPLTTIVEQFGVKVVINDGAYSLEPIAPLESDDG